MEKKTYYLLAFWFFVLNLFDALATILLVVELGVAEEINPIMEHLLKLGPWKVFFFTKMLVGGLFCYGMLRFRKESPSFTKWSLIGCLAVYNLVMLKHVFIMLQTCT